MRRTVLVLAWAALSCTVPKDTAGPRTTGPTASTTSPPDTAPGDTAETGACADGDGSLRACVWYNERSASAIPGASVYVIAPGDKLPLEGRTGADGCLAFPLAAGPYEVWAVTEGGMCSSERADVAIEACVETPIDLYTEDGCIG